MKCVVFQAKSIPGFQQIEKKEEKVFFTEIVDNKVCFFVRCSMTDCRRGGKQQTSCYPYETTFLDFKGKGTNCPGKAREGTGAAIPYSGRCNGRSSSLNS